MVEWSKTKFLGVRFWESETRTHNGKPDRCYVIRYKRHGKAFTETIGWGSNGVTPQLCANIRGGIVQNVKVGSGHQSLAEKRELEKERLKTKSDLEETAKKENTPFDVLAQRYLEWVKHNKKSWKDDASRYLFHIKPVLGHIPLKDISVIHMERLKKECQKKECQRNSKEKKRLSPATVKHVLVLTRQMFNRGVGWGLYDRENPVKITIATDKKFLKIPDNRRHRFLSREEARLLLTKLALKNQQVHDICLISLYTGLRLGETFNLRWADIDFEHGIIQVKDTKSGESRTAYMTGAIKEMLKRQRTDDYKKDAFVFTARGGGQIKELSNLFQRVVDELFNKGVTDPRDKVIGHTLRHTFASWLAMAGEPLVTIQRLMGHKSIEMTLRYAHLSPSHERSAILRLEEQPADAKVVGLRRNRK